jgi:hypothetical protein
MWEMINQEAEKLKAFDPLGGQPVFPQPDDALESG